MRNAAASFTTSASVGASMDDVILNKAGFRNVAVHDYTRLNLDIVRSIIEHRLEELLAFSAVAIRTGA